MPMISLKYKAGMQKNNNGTIQIMGRYFILYYIFIIFFIIFFCDICYYICYYILLYIILYFISFVRRNEMTVY